MSFHKSNLGSFAGGIKADINGYVPEANDGPWDFAIDHAERTHNEDGSLTEYGEWWEEDGFPQWQEECVEATKKAQNALGEWQ